MKNDLRLKHILSVIFICISIWHLNAQNPTKSSPIDSLAKKKNIAVVPFMPQMYQNDLSRLWYKTGEMTSHQTQLYEISRQIAHALADSLLNEYELTDLNESQTISTTDFLLEFYGLGSIAYADTFPQKTAKAKWLKNKSAFIKPHESGPDNGNIRLTEEERQDQFINFKIRDLKRYVKLCKELEVDQVLFINQFDVKGDFGSPYQSGRETNYFINIHYALYDDHANLLLGNKTKHTTTNEKARYRYFLENDLTKSTHEITKKISEMLKIQEEIQAELDAKLAKKKKKKQ